MTDGPDSRRRVPPAPIADGPPTAGPRGRCSATPAAAAGSPRRRHEAWDAHADDWVIPVEEVDEPGFALAERFGRTAPLVVEIGSGVGRGDRRAGRRAARPRRARPGGVAARRRRVAGRGGRRPAPPTCGSARSTRSGPSSTWSRPAGWRGCGPSSPTRGPRPGTTSAAWCGRASPRWSPRGSAPGAEWRLATDWPHYAEQMAAVLDAEPGLVGGVVERWAERPVTKFERKGVEAGRADHRPALRAPHLSGTTRT